MKYHRPEDLFRAEKERAQTVRNSQHARLLAEAKAAFDKLMAEGQAARKSGRPRKHPLPPLKTSSSRPPVKPVAPAPVAKPALPAKPAAPVAPAKVAKAAKVTRVIKAVKSAKVATARKPVARKPSAKAKPKKSSKR